MKKASRVWKLGVFCLLLLLNVPAAADDDARFAELLDAGRQLVILTRYEEAVPVLEDAAALRPRHLETHLLLAQAYAGLDRQPTAAALLGRLVDGGEDHPLALLRLAEACAAASRPADAESAYRRLLDRGGTKYDDEARLGLGRLLLDQGRPAAAQEVLEGLAEPDRKGLFALARARAESGDAKAAIDAYERFLAADSLADALRERAQVNLALLRERGAPSPLVPRRRDAPLPVVLEPAAASSGVDFVHDSGASAARHLPETMGSGLAWLDYDGDGWWDLYLVQSGAFPPDGGARASNRLYRNLGGGRFEDVTSASAAGDRSYGQGVLAADFDGDGFTDLYLANYGPDVLLRNEGDGSFSDATARVGLGLDGWSSGATAADVDGDGYLDLYVTRYVDYDPASVPFCGDRETGESHYCSVFFFVGAEDRFYRSHQGRFLVTGPEVRGRGMSAVLTDLDGDRRPDLYVADDMNANSLFRIFGNADFEDVSLLSGASVNSAGREEASMGLAVGDVDNDGRPDLALTHFDLETNTLYHNLGGLTFDDVSAVSGFGPPSLDLLSFGIVLADLDLDGDLDAYIANGHVFDHPLREGVARAQCDLVLAGDGAGYFQVTQGERLCGVGRGVASADVDNDGDPDVGVQQNGGAFEWLRNASDALASGRSRWLGVEVRVGGRATLLTRRPDGTARRQTRWAVAGGSYQSSSDTRLLFIWPAEETVELLEVEAPGGVRLRIRSPPDGVYLTFPQT